MSKITFEYIGTVYTLEFDRDSAAKAEQLYDVNLNDLTKFQISQFESLFRGALIKHHPNIKHSTATTLFNALNGKVELYQELATMFAETLNTALEDNDAEGEGVSWEKA